MNQTHLHLLITHLPIFGSLLGGIVLAHGLYTKSNQTKIAAYNLFIIAAFGAMVAYLSGEGAEESVEDLQGVVEASIKQHEDFAIYALISLMALGFASLIGIWLTIQKSSLTRSIAIAIISLSLISFILIARTGYLGGQIRHTELHSSTNQTQDEKAGDDD
ncbi:MAG: hypothetical protein RL060_2205 [Bacteroidota bacterium]|jgi:uncharacterized membrane protein